MAVFIAVIAVTIKGDSAGSSSLAKITLALALVVIAALAAKVEALAPSFRALAAFIAETTAKATTAEGSPRLAEAFAFALAFTQRLQGKRNLT